MSGHIASVVCFVTVLMTSHDVNGQTHDVAQLNRKLTIIKNSIDGDIVDIRLEIMELKMIVQQILVGQRSASDGSIIGQGMPAGVNQNEITDLKNKLKDHENRLNRLFNTETKCEDRVNALQKHFEETLAAMMKGNTKLKAHVTVSVVNQIHNLSQTMKSEHSKLSARIDHTDANIVRLAGGVNALQNTFEETAAIQMAGYKDLETHMSVQMNNLSQSVITKQNILSASVAGLASPSGVMTNNKFGGFVDYIAD